MRSGEFALLGAGGHASSVADVLVRLGARVTLVVADRADPRWPRVVRSDDDGLRLACDERLGVVLAVGDNTLRSVLLGKAEDVGASLPPVVATTATVASDARLDPGAVLMEHVHVGPGAVIGKAVIVNTGADVEHDARIGPITHLAPRVVIGGGAAIGRGVLVGTGAVVLPGCVVGDGVTVAAGAVVHRDVADGLTVAGVPGRSIPEVSG